MRQYLATLHKPSPQHKKHFALGVSGGVTLVIFALWSVVNFGSNGTIAKSGVEVERAHPEVSPLESLRTNVASSFQGIIESFSGLKNEVEKVKVETQTANPYTDLRSNQLEIYGN